MTGRLSNLEYDEFGHPIANVDEPELCATCHGTGADPLSDNVNWLPCSTCHGSGQVPSPETEIPF